VGAQPQPPPEPTIRELAAQAALQAAGLVGQEFALAKAEFLAKARQAGAGAVLMATAGVLGGTAWLVLVAAAIAGIAVALPLWASALIMGGALGCAAGGIALIAGRRIGRVSPPLPLTAESIRRDLAVARQRNSH
jgi:hypothetical protein